MGTGTPPHHRDLCSQEGRGRACLRGSPRPPVGHRPRDPWAWFQGREVGGDGPVRQAPASGARPLLVPQAGPGRRRCCRGRKRSTRRASGRPSGQPARRSSRWACGGAGTADTSPRTPGPGGGGGPEGLLGGYVLGPCGQRLDWAARDTGTRRAHRAVPAELSEVALALLYTLGTCVLAQPARGGGRGGTGPRDRPSRSLAGGLGVTPCCCRATLSRAAQEGGGTGGAQAWAAGGGPAQGPRPAHGGAAPPGPTEKAAASRTLGTWRTACSREEHRPFGGGPGVTRPPAPRCRAEGVSGPQADPGSAPRTP